MKATAIIVGAGAGVRMNRATPKQYLPLGRMPILAHAVQSFNACEDVAEIILVVPQQDLEYCSERILSGIDLKKPLRFVAGGARRQDSVASGLAGVNDPQSIIAVHDGVRPFIEAHQISACIAGAEESGACILAVPVSDSLKVLTGDAFIETSVDRKGVWQAQTPQAFRYEILFRAHESARRDGFSATDDASLVERMGIRVKVIPGSRRNIKITDPEDLFMAEAILAWSTP